VISDIDEGKETEASRPSTVSSIVSKLKTRSKNGKTDIVDAALKYIAGRNQTVAKDLIGVTNSVWSLTGKDSAYYSRIANPETRDGEVMANQVNESELAGMLPVVITGIDGNTVTFTKYFTKYQATVDAPESYSLGEMTMLQGPQSGKQEAQDESADDETASQEGADTPDESDTRVTTMTVKPIELNPRVDGISTLNGVKISGVDYSKISGTEKQRAWAIDKIERAFSDLIKDQIKAQIGSDDLVDTDLLDAGFRQLNEIIAKIEIGKRIEDTSAKAWIEGSAHQMLSDMFMQSPQTDKQEAQDEPVDGDVFSQENQIQEVGEVDEVDQVRSDLRALMSVTDTTEAMDSLERLLDEAEAAGIDIENDPDILAASDRITALLEQEQA